MWTSAIIEVEVAADRSTRLANAVVGSQIDLLVLDAPPQAFDEHVVPPSSLAVHADSNAVVGEHAGERRAGELRALVRVEDVRLAMKGQSIRQRFDAECRFHRDRYAPRQHATAEPVEHDGQIDVATRHRNVSDKIG